MDTGFQFNHNRKRPHSDEEEGEQAMQTRSNLSNSPMVHGSRRKENKLRLPHESVATLEEGQTSTVLEQSPRKRIKLESKNDTEPTDGALSCPDIAVIERNISAGVQAVHADVDNNEAMLDQQRIIRGAINEMHTRANQYFLTLVEDFQKEITDGRKENARLRARIAELEQTETDVKDLQHELRFTKQMVEEKEDEVNEWKERHDTLKEEHDDLQERHGGLKEWHDELKEKICDLIYER